MTQNVTLTFNILNYKLNYTGKASNSYGGALWQRRQVDIITAQLR